MKTIDLNADAGESYGRWTLGDDEALFPLISSVNTACGWHGGDPAIMRKSVRLAKEHGIALGAHPGFPDLMGFGRRMMDVSHEEVIDMMTYQVGALLAFAEQEGVRLNHIKPHSKLYVTIARDDDLMCKVADAMLALQPDLVFFMLAGRAADNLRKHGYNTCAEVVADMEYTDEGDVIIESRPPAKDPEYVARRAVDMVSGIVETIGGRRLELDADTICIHGDRPNVLDIAKSIRSAFDREGISLNAPSATSSVRF
ncbi:5-oxoprolinase subunit PxpA [Arthrobacter sp. OAP107]|uniref:LamB/YcsF family protein n=1 Tax=Arthrobacter sp. OAP107 TaxID=3156445 RepID=UPI00339564F4